MGESEAIAPLPKSVESGPLEVNPMSLTQTPQRTTRVNRSELAVPASNPRFIEAAARGDADVVFLDLEDAVAPNEKEQARKRKGDR